MPAEFPLVTIGITCYNAKDTINKALASALAQSWPNVEIVVVDDCSTDGSVDLVEDLAKQDARIRLIKHSENFGVGKARNSLLKEARGEFLAFFDDDDESLPQRINEQWLRITEYEKLTGVDFIACFTARLQQYPNGKRIYEPTLGTRDIPGPKANDVAKQILIGKPIRGEKGTCASCSMMARLKVFQMGGGFNPKLRRGEDLDFNLRFALAGGQITGISTPLVIQTMTFTQDKRADEYRKSILDWIEHNKAHLERYSWYDFSIRWFEMKFDYVAGKRVQFARKMVSLFFRSPLKFATRLYWSLPNKRHFWRSMSEAEIRGEFDAS